ncbi:jg8443 [Pararge aegeria aegeria]|uniref:Jg8443 protein n=1 Tax=Pararge aegeria aegeria TaxID=348720 RepID=A0A8S4S678_9NEOP|nr:jg8443 [Pararge aegeria aegeria]
MIRSNNADRRGTTRPRRNRQSSIEKASANSQSCEQLPSTSSPVKTLYSLPERLSESSDNIDCKRIQQASFRCPSCDGLLDSDEHTQLSLPAPLDATTQTKRKKNFMDRCVNKVRLC